MKLLADTHAHFYEMYDLALYINSAAANFNKAGVKQKTAGVLLLTQGAKNSSETDVIYSELIKSGINASSQNGLITVSLNADLTLYILTGGQFVSSEGIEVLALTYAGERLDKLPVLEILKKITDYGAVPVLPWSPGKWLGKRKEIILSLINQNQEFLIGDIPIRSFFKPDIFNIAAHKNKKFIHGSDSLPMKGEEVMAAAYLSEFDVSDDFIVSNESVRELLLGQPCRPAGKRDTIFMAVRRWLSFFLKSRLG